MATHFAQIDKNGIVLRVIVADQTFINTGAVGDPATWIQTSYDTAGGVSKTAVPPLRMNYAGVGYKYDAVLDAFIPPTPFPSWVLNKATCLWVAPIPMPADGKKYLWNEKTQSWVQFQALTDASAVQVTIDNASVVTKTAI